MPAMDNHRVDFRGNDKSTIDYDYDIQVDINHSIIVVENRKERIDGDHVLP